MEENVQLRFSKAVDKLAYWTEHLSKSTYLEKASTDFYWKKFYADEMVVSKKEIEYWESTKDNINNTYCNVNGKCFCKKCK